MTTFDKWLKRRKMTTDEFAKLAGISKGTADRWRTGAKPRPLSCMAMRGLFPTCPIFKA